ncbi:S1/P1 nuclease [Thermodesulfovibrio sp.]|jgi:hypothetical protein
MRMRRIINYTIFLLILIFYSYANAWDCKTHAYIAQKAGIRIPEAACMPDIIRDENYELLAPMHYHNAAPNTVVTPEYIDKYAVKEVTVNIDGRTIKILLPHQAGVLYWKIVNLYEKMKSLDKTKPDNRLSYEYYLVTIAHYIGDLSQPLHNFPYSDSSASDGKIYIDEGAFNKEYHIKFDEAFDSYIGKPQTEEKLNKALKEIKISNTENLKNEISKIANSAIKIANQCYKEKRMPTEEELIEQISWSVSLLKAVIKSTY